MAEKKLNKNMKLCATCARWGGNRKSEFGGWASFEENQKGKCSGGLFNNAEMYSMASCAKWEVWPPIR
jgi:hypothetical protein